MRTVQIFACFIGNRLITAIQLNKKGKLTMIKRIISLFAAFIMLCPVAIYADESDDGIIDCDLPKINDSSITIDGKNDEKQWESAAKVELRQDNTGMWAGMISIEHHLPVDAYFMWSESGIYVYADITDNDPVYDGQHDCFEVAFNPGGIIPKEDDLQGMFFMFWPIQDGVAVCTRHNMSEDTKGGIEAENVIARWTETEKGWTIEGIIPWDYICDPERQVYVRKRKTAPLLRGFEIEEGAFLMATVCRLNGDEETQYCAVYRTCTDNYAENFYTDSYNVRFNLAAAIDPPEESSTGGVESFAPVTSVDHSTDTDIVSTDAAEKDGAEVNYTVFAVIGIICICIIVFSVGFLIAFLIRKKKVK